MRKLNTVLVILFIICMILSVKIVGAFASNGLTNREEDGYFGPVKSVTVYWEGKTIPLSITVYRSDGSREMKTWNINENTIITTFDNKGRGIKYETEKMGERKLTGYSEYDDEKHICKSYSQDPDKLPREIVDELTVTGDPKETRHYSPEGKYIGNSLYEYNERGLLVLLSRFNEKGICFDKTEFLYCENGQYKEINTYYRHDFVVEGKEPYFLKRKTKYIYDDKGRLVEKCSYGEEVQRLTYKVVYSDFDKYGNATKVIDDDIDGVLNKFFPPIKFIKYEYFE